MLTSLFFSGESSYIEDESIHESIDNISIAHVIIPKFITFYAWSQQVCQKLRRKSPNRHFSSRRFQFF